VEIVDENTLHKIGREKLAESVEETSKKTLRVTDMPGSERPRERLRLLGSEALSAQEILAIILGSGSGESVMTTAQRLLNEFGDFEGLASASVEDLDKVRGIGPAKACHLKASFEMANRIATSTKSTQRRIIKTPEDAYLEIKGRCQGEQREHFWEILLTTRNRLIQCTEISVGSLDTSIVHPREVFKTAIAVSAASIIVAHNHPSGSHEPSADDISLTKRLIEAGKLVGIDVVDHLVIGSHGYLSMKREGLI
jgi:DNA repair protein RadC